MLYDYITEKRNDSPELKETMESSAQLIIDNETDIDNPGIFLGMIQSGKTRAFIGILAKCFDSGYDACIVLTKSSKALVAQTVRRFKSEFKEPLENDYLNVYDIMQLPPRLTPFILRKKLVFIVKKEDDNLRKLHNLFFEEYSDLENKRVLIIDDEADFASVSYANDRGMPDGVRFGVLANMISDFRNRLNSSCDYLQVTATPYSLFLQPNEIIVNDGIYAPLRPRFTKILKPHENYIGGNYYFEESLDTDSPASNLHIPVPDGEFDRLRRPDTRYLDSIHTTPNLRVFRSGLINFIVGGSIRLIQEEHEVSDDFPWRKVYKCSYLIHTEQRTEAHNWQANLTQTLIDRINEMIRYNDAEFVRIITESYDNLSLSVSKTSFYLPTIEKVVERVKRAIVEGEISVREVNSIAQVVHQLDETGQLRLDNPFNIFIGGQVLERGITIENLIGFFYGRNPRSFQMDTVLQHSRMYGARKKQDLSVTRIYTSPRIYLAMLRMYHFDRALRESIEESGSESTVRFIERDPCGGIRPCSPSKIRISNLQALRGFTRILPIGFQTKSATIIRPLISSIDEIISNLHLLEENVYESSLDDAIRIISIISETFEYREHWSNIGWEWNKDEFIEVLRYTSTLTDDNRINILLRSGRNIGRTKNNDSSFTDAPDDGRTDLPIARSLASENPTLILLKQQGNENKGWRGSQFYWPVLITPQITPSSVYTEN